MKPLKIIGAKQPKIRLSGPRNDRVDPAIVARALGADPPDCPAIVSVRALCFRPCLPGTMACASHQNYPDPREAEIEAAHEALAKEGGWDGLKGLDEFVASYASKVAAEACADVEHELSEATKAVTTNLGAALKANECADAAEAKLVAALGPVSEAEAATVYCDYLGADSDGNRPPAWAVTKAVPTMRAALNAFLATRRTTLK